MTTIRETTATDIDQVLQVEASAFGPDEGPVITALVSDLLDDPSARPLLSLIAVDEERVLGHILFTHVALAGKEEKVRASILCPLAVTQNAQSRGIGGELIKAGLARLQERGVELVFVLGHPGYYPRFGFVPAGQYALYAPYPIPDRNADAWMVQALQPDILGKISGTLTCAESLQRPEYWLE